jgi:hypothetical protein
MRDMASGEQARIPVSELVGYLLSRRPPSSSS